MKRFHLTAMAFAMASTPVFASDVPVVVAVPGAKAPPTTVVITGSATRDVPPLPQVSYAFAAAQEAAKVADEAAKAARYADAELNSRLTEMAASLASVRAELAQVKAQMTPAPAAVEPTVEPTVEAAPVEAPVEQVSAAIAPIAEPVVQVQADERVLFPHLRQYMKARAAAEREERERALAVEPMPVAEAAPTSMGKRFVVKLSRVVGWAGLGKAAVPAPSATPSDAEIVVSGESGQ